MQLGWFWQKLWKVSTLEHLRYEVAEDGTFENWYDALHGVNLLFQGLDVKRSVGSLYDFHRIQKPRVPFLRLQCPANYGLGVRI
jgi:hypothetical protein